MLNTKNCHYYEFYFNGTVKSFNDIQPSKNFDCLDQAAKASEESDWLIGMNCTMALTKRLKSKDKLSYSVARVQTPTLRMIVDRENEILEHIPEKYWKIEAVFKALNHKYDGTLIIPNRSENKSFYENF